MTTRNYTPKHSRQEDTFKFQPTERDLRIIETVNKYRYLRAEQVKRLISPQNKSIEGIRRRLKYLFHAGFLGRIIPFVQPGKGGASLAYYLDKKGAELLKENGQEVLSYSDSKIGQVKSMFLNHALDLSDFRIFLESGIKDHPFLFLKNFTADFELRSQTKKIIGNHKYKLYKEVAHPLNRKKYVVYPDGMFVFQGKGKYSNVERLYFIEIDRGTETLGVIRDKVIGYWLYAQKQIFNNEKGGKFNGFKVFFQCNTEKRSENIRKSLTNLEGSEFVWTTDVSKVNEKSVLYEPIWTDSKLELKSMLKPLKV